MIIQLENKLGKKSIAVRWSHNIILGDQNLQKQVKATQHFKFTVAFFFSKMQPEFQNVAILIQRLICTK